MLAEHRPAKPERKLLFADATRTLEQETRRKGATLDRTPKVLARGVVSVQREEGHIAR